MYQISDIRYQRQHVALCVCTELWYSFMRNHEYSLKSSWHTLRHRVMQDASGRIKILALVSHMFALCTPQPLHTITCRLKLNADGLHMLPEGTVVVAHETVQLHRRLAAVLLAAVRASVGALDVELGRVRHAAHDVG